MDQPVVLFTYITSFAYLALVAVVIAKMALGQIDLGNLLSESESKKASLSRFQLLVFTFVVAGLYLILSFEAGQLVEIPESTLGLLGISGGSYLVSKSISSGVAVKRAQTPPDSTDGTSNNQTLR